MSLKTLYRGNVTKSDANGTYVEIPHLGVGFEVGPCQAPVDLVLATGDKVLLGQIENVAEDFVIIQKIGAVGENWGRADSISRVIYAAGSYPARPAVLYVEWVGPTPPPAATVNDTWVNTTP